MGTYVNPGNDGFAQIVAGDYVDKTGLIALVNGTANTPESLVCSARTITAACRCTTTTSRRCAPW